MSLNWKWREEILRKILTKSGHQTKKKQKQTTNKVNNNNDKKRWKEVGPIQNVKVMTKSSELSTHINKRNLSTYALNHSVECSVLCLTYFANNFDDNIPNSVILYEKLVNSVVFKVA